MSISGSKAGRCLDSPHLLRESQRLASFHLKNASTSCLLYWDLCVVDTDYSIDRPLLSASGGTSICSLWVLAIGHRPPRADLRLRLVSNRHLLIWSISWLAFSSDLLLSASIEHLDHWSCLQMPSRFLWSQSRVGSVSRFEVLNGLLRVGAFDESLDD